MVTTASAPATASAALAQRTAPASTALASASSDRSKARTAKPFFNRLAAMPPPILPRPIKAMVWLISRHSFFLSAAQFGQRRPFLFRGQGREQAVDQFVRHIDRTHGRVGKCWYVRL